MYVPFFPLHSFTAYMVDLVSLEQPVPDSHRVVDVHVVARLSMAGQGGNEVTLTVVWK